MWRVKGALSSLFAMPVPMLHMRCIAGRAVIECATGWPGSLHEREAAAKAL